MKHVKKLIVSQVCYILVMLIGMGDGALHGKKIIGSGNSMEGANTVFGPHALDANISGTHNTVFGCMGLRENGDGSLNTAVGSYALTENTDGDHNTAIGAFALMGNNNGASNTAVGSCALRCNEKGSNNVAIGYRAGVGHALGNDNIYLGSNVASPKEEHSTVRIGNDLSACYISGIYGGEVAKKKLNVFIDADNKLGVNLSSRRFKKNIQPLQNSLLLEKVRSLHPVSFSYKKDATNSVEYGLIAEEVAEELPELVVTDNQHKPLSVRYDLFTPILIHAYQDLYNQHQRLADDCKQMRQEIRELRSHLQKIKK